MPDSSTGFMLALAVFVCAALALATRYHTDHPLHDLLHWLRAHHWLDGLHRRH
jgi:hypothetical protein